MRLDAGEVLRESGVFCYKGRHGTHTDDAVGVVSEDVRPVGREVGLLDQAGVSIRLSCRPM